MFKCKKVFKESKEVPSPPFTRNSLTIKRIAKKVKGEGLKTLFYIYLYIRVKGKGKNRKKDPRVKNRKNPKIKNII